MHLTGDLRGRFQGGWSRDGEQQCPASFSRFLFSGRLGERWGGRMDAAGWLSDSRRGQNQEPYWKLLFCRRSAQGGKCGYRVLHFDLPVLRVAEHYFLTYKAIRFENHDEIFSNGSWNSKRVLNQPDVGTSFMLRLYRSNCCEILSSSFADLLQSNW